MEYKRLSKNSKKTWFIARAITTIIVSAILIGGKYFLLSKFKFSGDAEWNLVINIVIGIIIGLLLLNTLIYPKIEYKQWRYMINKDKIEFSEGIYYITTTIVPIVRVQHIKVNQGPINRIYKLADLHIYTAGGSHKIPNIEVEKAEEISSYLKDKIREKVEQNDR